MRKRRVQGPRATTTSLLKDKLKPEKSGDGTVRLLDDRKAQGQQSRLMQHRVAVPTIDEAKTSRSIVDSARLVKCSYASNIVLISYLASCQ